MDPGNPHLWVKLAGVHLDAYDFDAAATAFEAALQRDPALPHVRPRLARCHNLLGRHGDALAILAAEDGPQHERALAWLALGEVCEAEREWRALLAEDPRHYLACRELGKLLRRSGRMGALLQLCEQLGARGAAHAQLFYTWGIALALAGEDERARALLFDPARVAEIDLQDHTALNSALAEEILSNPYRLSNFPAQDEANRGSSRVHALFAGGRPDLVRTLLEAIQGIVDGHASAPRAGFDPWPKSRPTAAHLKAWGLIQRGGDYEEWHLHRGGWLSGVYYVRVPDCASIDGHGPGCIEFGPPRALERARPGFIPVQRYRPREGMLLLAPSHYSHRTIPTGADEYRISLAFDVVAD